MQAVRLSVITLAGAFYAGGALAAGACVPGEPSFWRDQALTTKLAAQLQFHKPLFRERVEVKVTGGAAILSGNVSTAALVREAERTAAGVSGIKCVQSYLKVGPPLPASAQ